MYTDDPQFLTVGVEWTKVALRVMRRLTAKIGLIMAIPEKRSLGTWAKWPGCFVVAGLGLIIIPRDKVMRACSAVRAALAGSLEFHAYRSLCGLLEHFRGVNLQSKQIMHGLYRPHAAARYGPAALVLCDALMVKQLRRWQWLLLAANGVSV